MTSCFSHETITPNSTHTHTHIKSYIWEMPVWIHGSFSFVQSDLISVARVTLAPEIPCLGRWIVGEWCVFMCLWVHILTSRADFFENCACFRDLLHDLEKCNADPVAIAECFVSKVKMVAPTSLCLQWWKLTQYIYSSTVHLNLKALYLNIFSLFCSCCFSF